MRDRTIQSPWVTHFAERQCNYKLASLWPGPVGGREKCTYVSMDGVEWSHMNKNQIMYNVF